MAKSSTFDKLINLIEVIHWKSMQSSKYLALKHKEKGHKFWE